VAVLEVEHESCNTKGPWGGKGSREMVSESTCPYCHQTLDRTPKRKKKCPICGNFVYVRGGRLYTNDQVQEHDYLGMWLYRLEHAYGVSKSGFEQHRSEVCQRRGFKATANDAVWSILNKLQIETDPRVDPQKAIDISLDMALFFEEEGRDPSIHIAVVNKARAIDFRKRLEEYQVDEWLHYVQVLGGDDAQSCSYCKSMHLTIHEKSEVPVVPLDCTSRLGCRCTLAAVIDEALPEGLQHRTRSSGKERKAWWKVWK
jgi:hypothetical protein